MKLTKLQVQQDLDSLPQWNRIMYGVYKIRTDNSQLEPEVVAAMIKERFVSKLQNAAFSCIIG